MRTFLIRKNLNIYIIIFLSILFLICSKNSASSSDNGIPCRISNPSDNSNIPKGGIIEISVDISYEKAGVSYIKFLIDDEIRLWDTESPYYFSWDTSVENPGSHSIKIIAKFEDETISEDEINITLKYVYKKPEDTGDGWETSTLEENNVDSTLIYQVMNDVTPDWDFLYSILIIRNGKLIFEEYFNGQDRDAANDIASATKSFTSTLIGIALKEGYLSGLDGKMLDYFPEFVTQNTDPRKLDITLRQLIKMRAGYPWDGNEILFPGIYSSSNWIEYMINIPLERDPGTGWDYSSGSTHIMSAILTKVTGMSTRDFAQTYLFGPVGIDIRYWPQDPQGYYFGHADIWMTPRNMAKLGYLYLQDGIINGERILPENWVQEATEFYSVMPYGDGIIFRRWGYGYFWWLWNVRGKKVFFAQGQGGQFILVIPELNAVIVLTAKTQVISNSNLNLEVAEEQQNKLYLLLANQLIFSLK
ncbi:serine hydrolase [candidate division KSB1 bacterium]